MDLSNEKSFPCALIKSRLHLVLAAYATLFWENKDVNRLTHFSLLSALAVATSAQQTRPTFLGGVSQVHIDVEVLSKFGAPIQGLTAGDFRILDENQEQPIVAFAANEQPLDIVLLFDISGSMRAQVEVVANSAKQALDQLHAGDQAAVMTFNDTTRIQARLTSDFDSIERSIHDIISRKFGGRTYLHQAVYDAATYLLKQQRTENRRRAILIISDNRGFRTVSESKVITRVLEADAVVSGVIVPSPGFAARRAVIAVLAPFALIQGGKGIDQVAVQTGGNLIHSDHPDTSLVDLVRRLRTRYSLYYTTPPGEPRHAPHCQS